MRTSPKSKRADRVPKGRVVTFYSYKGGTGRSMALANVAWMLALSGERVLVIDWDLEAPGIHRYFHPFLEDKDLRETDGLLDFVIKLAGRAAISDTPLREEDVDVTDYIKMLNWPARCGIDWKNFGEWAGIDLMVAGRQGPLYGQSLNGFNWIDFYTKLSGRQLLSWARKQMREIYDYILIDSRTGVSDTSGICTVEMPDTLVVCFTLNDQSIKGASGILESVLKQRAELVPVGTTQERLAQLFNAGLSSPAEFIESVASGSEETETQNKVIAPCERPIMIVAVPTRVEVGSERAKREFALAYAQTKFEHIVTHMSPSQRGQYWQWIQLPYVPFYAFEEIPAIFGDTPDDQSSLARPSRQIASYITGDTSLKVTPLHEDYDRAARLRKSLLDLYLRRRDTPEESPAQLAQSLYERSEEETKVLIQRIMLRLINVTENAPPSMTTIPVEDFGTDEKEQTMLNILRREKLVVTAGSSVALSDKSLIEDWELLRAWLTERTLWLLWRQRLNVAAKSWRDHGMDSSALLRGPLLAEASTKMEIYPADLNPIELQFVFESMDAAKKETDQAAQKMKEEARHTSRLRWAGIISLFFIIIFAVYGVSLFMKREQEVAMLKAEANNSNAALHAANARLGQANASGQLPNANAISPRDLHSNKAAAFSDSCANVTVNLYPNSIQDSAKRKSLESSWAMRGMVINEMTFDSRVQQVNAVWYGSSVPTVCWKFVVDSLSNSGFTISRIGNPTNDTQKKSNSIDVGYSVAALKKASGLKAAAK